MIFFVNLYAQIGFLKVNERFEDNTFTTMDGEQVILDSIHNKVFVMNFWNIGCTGCEQERTFLNELYHNYKNQDVVFWSITMTSKEKLDSYLKKHPIDWEVKGGIDFLGFKGDQTFLVNCIPTTILIDKERNVIYSQCGTILEGESGDYFMKLIDGALSK
ncbi:peroxiredoxin family protein [Ekhidna sp.]